MDLAVTVELIISLVACVWMVICRWRIFSKAWRKWWEALIPIWNAYVYFKIAWRKWWFWAMILVPIVWFVVSLLFWIIWNVAVASSGVGVAWIQEASNMGQWSILIIIKNIINRLLGMTALVVPLIGSILVQFSMAKRFGKSWWFGLWLLLLTPIFIGILAFDDSEYHAE